MKLTSPATIRTLLEQHGAAALRSLGQNFLADENMLCKIADAALEPGGARPGGNVLEIGPGLGALTLELSARAERVNAVEIDKGMVRILAHTLEGRGNVRVVHADFLKFDLNELDFAGQTFSVASNLPYYISTPVILKLLSCGQNIEYMTLLVQKEVAGRMAAKPGGRQYGSLSIAVQHSAEFEVLFKVPPGCFYPAPEVESALVRITPREPAVRPRDERRFFELVRCAFSMRRKTLANNFLRLGIERERTEAILKAMGLDERARGESLSAAEFADLSDLL